MKTPASLKSRTLADESTPLSTLAARSEDALPRPSAGAAWAAASPSPWGLAKEEERFEEDDLMDDEETEEDEDDLFDDDEDEDDDFLVDDDEEEDDDLDMDDDEDEDDDDLDEDM